MPKKKTLLILMKSSESHYCKISKKSLSQKKKLELKKFDPVLRKHVIFREKKVNKPKN